jgi:hypothetical protein
MEKIQIGDLTLYKGVNFNQIETKTELGEAKIFIDCFSLSKEDRLKIAKMNAKDRKYDYEGFGIKEKVWVSVRDAIAQKDNTYSLTLVLKFKQKDKEIKDNFGIICSNALNVVYIEKAQNIHIGDVYL